MNVPPSQFQQLRAGRKRRERLFYASILVPIFLGMRVLQWVLETRANWPHLAALIVAALATGVCTVAAHGWLYRRIVRRDLERPAD